MAKLLIDVVAWLWDKFGKSLAGKVAGTLVGRVKRLKWRRALKGYREKVRRVHGDMHIMGMTRPVPLDNIFTDLYMLPQLSAYDRSSVEQLLDMYDADPYAPPVRGERINGLSYVRDGRNLFIQGKPGAGKTTFLQYIALQAAAQNIDKVPILLELRDWADKPATGLLPFIAERFGDFYGLPNAEPFIEGLLKSGKAIVLFDGLDEISRDGELRDERVRGIMDFARRYDRTQCLVTCRVGSAVRHLQSFIHVEVADFTSEQIEQFVRNWFRNQKGERDKVAAGKFLAKLKRDDNKGIRELARTPLLLTLLCIAYGERQTLPRRLVEIYNEVVDVLLKRWDTTRGIQRDEVYRNRDEVYHNLSPERVENMLASIAAETFEKREYFIPQERLEQLIAEYVRNIPPHESQGVAKAETILKTIEAQHGLLVESARKVYSFSHLPLQEYFAARHIVANAARGSLKRLARKHCGDARWSEVFRLTTSMLPDAGRFTVAFRRSIDDLLDGDELLQSLLAWACEKASPLDLDPWIARPYYLLIDLYYPLLVRASDPARAISFERAHERARMRERKRVRGLDVDLDLARALGRARNRHHKPGSAKAFAQAILHAQQRASDLGLHGLVEELRAYPLPKDDSTDAEWQCSADNLQALMRKHRKIGNEWNLSGEQEERLQKYLDSTDLLRDCLGLASMEPGVKMDLLNSLYLPPQKVSAGRTLRAGDGGSGQPPA